MKQILSGLALLVSAIAYYFLAYGIERSNFYGLISAYGLAFLAYAYLIFNFHSKLRVIEKNENYSIKKLFSLRNLLITAIFFRIIFLLSLPILSDDYFRFFWDGKLLTNGLNPYLYLPSEFIQTNQAASLGFDQELYQALNSPNYYTVYPPLNQLFFGLGSTLFPNNIRGAVVVMRLVIILAEIGTVIFLWKLLPLLKISRSAIIFYAFNPLVIVELSGNLHFEAVVLCFVVMSFYYLTKGKEGAGFHLMFASLLYAFAIATKLIPLIFLPAFLRKLFWRKALIFYSWIGIFLLALFLPFFSWSLVENMLSSVNLYFKSFEFNASIYYLVRWWGFQEYGYNIIASAGKNLSKLALLIILVLSFSLAKQHSWKQIFGRMLFILSTYYFLTTTVHPWYICNLVLLSVFTQFRYAVFWSGMAVLSYAAYQTDTYAENLYLVALEYLVVYGVLLWEILGIRVIKQIKVI